MLRQSIATVIAVNAVICMARDEPTTAGNTPTTAATAATTAPASTRPAAAPVRDGQPFEIRAIVRQNPPLHLHVVKVDLSHPRLEVVIAPAGPDPDGDGPWETILKPTSAIAKEQKLDLAINSVFFAHESGPKSYLPGEKARSVGRVVSRGKVFSTATGEATLRFDERNIATIETSKRVPAEAFNSLNAGVQLVFRGKPTAAAVVKDRAPRTGVGVARDGRQLIIVVVDGRRDEWSVGMNMKELADELIAQGAQEGMNFDGGGSSTLVGPDKDKKLAVLNLPSDGSTAPIPLSIERPVPYVLGFRVRDE